MHREVGWASPKGPTRREKKRKRGERGETGGSDYGTTRLPLPRVSER